MIVNYFELLNMPQTLPVDLSLLNQHYQTLQKKYHPDSYALASEKEKSEAVLQSSMINSAYQALKSLPKAAEHILQLNGVDMDAEQTTLRDVDFLKHQFDLREQLDEIEDSENWEMLEAFLTDIKNQKQQTELSLSHVINQKEFDMAQRYIDKLRYYSRLLEHIESLQDKQFAL